MVLEAPVKSERFKGEKKRQRERRKKQKAIRTDLENADVSCKHLDRAFLSSYLDMNVSSPR